MSPTTRFQVARVYDEPRPEDGERILVDRLWPRGFRRDDPRVGRWYKDAAPSGELRNWFHHQPERHDEFVARYQDELQTPQGAAALDGLRELVRGNKTVTLVTAARDASGSHAAVLADLLAGR
ncbi:DUF488 domain-containing protein [Mycolicibacter minnesotensis]